MVSLFCKTTLNEFVTIVGTIRFKGYSVKNVDRFVNMFSYIKILKGNKSSDIRSE